MEGSPPNEAVPFVWADFNARGWAGKPDDCLYALDRGALERIAPTPGLVVFVWDEDEPGSVLGCMATLEQAVVGSFSGWRARPIAGSFYRGPRPAALGGVGA
jgi:hypothetical protein